MYVPLRAIGSIFGYATTWNSESFTASLNGGVSPSYTEDELYWLSRIISAEAEGESYMGKLAVGTVVLNRVHSSEFPDTIYGVIFDRKNGVQFTPVANGTIYKTPDSESIAAARECLEGGTVDGDILFFMNASLAESFWISAQRKHVMTVGNHDFYA
ncbi:MAG: cell wall hydrolase [Clostridia bacterium]|nr:cell wall hydrolase [Clostridia bacterium]